MEKMRPKSFAVVKKARQVLKKSFFRKKKSSSLFVQISSSKRCAEFFKKINGSQDNVSAILRSREMVLDNTINKTRLTKSQENSAHRFVGNYLANNFAKFLQDRIKP